MIAAHRTWLPAARPTARLHQGFRAQRKRTCHPEKPSIQASGGERGDSRRIKRCRANRYPTEKQQPEINSLNTQSNLPLKNEAYQHLASLYPR